jgi:DNA-binding CsgD family transcriptional regulator
MPDRKAIEFGVELLTQRERDCLALVASHLKSKEIGKELGLSHHTVNQHIASAVRRLKVANRFKAAALYAEYVRGLEAESSPDTGPIPKNRDAADYSVGMAPDGPNGFYGGGTKGDFNEPGQSRTGASARRAGHGKPRLAADDLGDGFGGSPGPGGGLPQGWPGADHGLSPAQAIDLLAARRDFAPDFHHGHGSAGRLLPTLNPINDLPVGTRLMFVVGGVVVLSLVFGLINLAVQSVGL